MTNNTPNGTPETVEEKKVISSSSVDALARAAIRMRIGQGAINTENIRAGYKVDPKRVNTIKYDKIQDEITQNMHVLADQYGEVFDRITPEELDEHMPSKSKIVRLLEEAIQPLKQSRSFFIKRIHKTFKDVVTLIPDIGSLEGRISGMTEDELVATMKSPKAIKKFLGREYGLDVDSLTVALLELKTVFHDIERVAPNLKKSFLYAISQYETYGEIPHKNLIKELFRSYTDIHRQQEIARYFDIDFTIQELVEFGIYSDADVQEIAKKTVGDVVWDKLDDIDKKKLTNTFRNNDTIAIDLDDAITQGIDSLSDKEKQALIDRAFGDRMEVLLNTEDEGNDIIMGDILPDKNGKFHTAWLEKMKRLLQGKVEGIEKLRAGSVFVFPDPKNPKVTHTLQLLDEDFAINAFEDGVRFEIISGYDGTISTGSGNIETLSYSLFGKMLLSLSGVKVLSGDEFQRRITHDPNEAGERESLLSTDQDTKILNVTQSNTLTEEAFVEELNLIDPSGTAYGIEEGTTFISHAGESGSEHIEVAYTITEIKNGRVYIKNGKDTEEADFETFINAARAQGFQRVGVLGDKDADFPKALGAFGVDSHTKLVDGQLVIEDSHSEHSDHGHDSHDSHDDHGHNGHAEKKETPKKYEYFESQTGGHIRIFHIGNGRVEFGEYASQTDLEDVRKANMAGKLSQKQKERLYDIQVVSYGMFLKYLKDGKFQATTEDLLGDQDAHYHGHHAHMEESLLKRWMKKPSIADIIHGVKGISHAIEHYLEKGSKLNASRTSLRMAKMLGLPADVIAQLQADEIGNMKEIIEKLVSKLQGLNGPVGRNKALHIVHSKGSRPEEVMAAALYMVKGYGHLYAEDIKHAQGSESFINALIYACGYTSDAQIEEQKKKARKKFKTDTGTELGGQITEEEMIWGFLKTIDGNATENPLAGALVKAMGGPSGWERAWRDEGHKGAIEKGKRQTGDIPNARGRLGKYFSALATHEFNTAAGMMMNVAGKAKSPDLQGAPVVWCLTGMTQYASTKLVQDELWQYSASRGHTFHAYSFLRNKVWNDLYKDVFLMAIDDIASPEDKDALKKAMNEVQYSGHDDPHKDRDAKKQLKNFELISSIWEKYQDRGLHDRLQGKNSWLVEQIHTHHNEKAAQYLDVIGNTTHKQMSKDQAPSNDNGWYDEYGHLDSPILAFTDDKLISFKWQINKIPKDGSMNFALRKDNFDRMWAPIVKAFDNLRGNQTIDPELKKKQYFQFRKDIVEHFRLLFNSMGKGEATEEVLRSLRSQAYSRDLMKMGISLEQIFTESYDINGEVAESDFEAWEQGGRGNSITQGNSTIQNRTKQIIHNVSEKVAANDVSYRQSA